MPIITPKPSVQMPHASFFFVQGCSVYTGRMWRRTPSETFMLHTAQPWERFDRAYGQGSFPLTNLSYLWDPSLYLSHSPFPIPFYKNTHSLILLLADLTISQAYIYRDHLISILDLSILSLT